MTLPELIERTESAKGADREIDEQIGIYLGWAEGLLNRWSRPDGTLTGHEGLPMWTASIDAAMTLVPEGAHISIVGPTGKTHSCRINGEVGLALSFPLAICAAALRARSLP